MFALKSVILPKKRKFIKTLAVLPSASRGVVAYHRLSNNCDESCDGGDQQVRHRQTDGWNRLTWSVNESTNSVTADSCSVENCPANHGSAKAEWKQDRTSKSKSGDGSSGVP